MADRSTARQLAADSIRNGDPFRWFEKLYQQAEGKCGSIPWADMVVNPNLAQWLAREGATNPKGKCLVVGCGLGDDAEALSKLDLEVTAFDIAATSIQWCNRRFPHSKVRYCVADLMNPPADWTRQFDFVFEAYTLQVLPRELRTSAIKKLAQFLSDDGILLVVTRGRDDTDEVGSMPWPLTRQEFEGFIKEGLVESQFEDYVEQEQPPVRRFRVEYRR